MRLQLHRCLIPLAACAFSLVTVAASAQTGDFLRGEATAVPTVRGVPFSAEGVVTLKLVLFDGTRIERTVPARYYRDTEGRVRREQTIMGISSLDPRKDAEAVVTIVDPVAGFVYTLVGNKREVQRMRLAAGTGASIEADLRELASAVSSEVSQRKAGIAKARQNLGTRDFDGVQAAGQRMTSTIPAGAMGNDRPIEVIDEVWTAQDLKLQVLTTHSDPRTGDVETRFTKITRAEPPADLFKIPAGYKIVDIPGAAK
jgi:hypothetical protein